MTTTNEQCGDYLHNMNGDDVKTWQLGRLRNERSNDERRPSFLRFLCLRKDERRLPSGGPRHLVPGRSPRPRAVAGRTSGSVRSIRTRSGTRHLMIRIIKKKRVNDFIYFSKYSTIRIEKWLPPSFVPVENNKRRSNVQILPGGWSRRYVLIDWNWFQSNNGCI